MNHKIIAIDDFEIVGSYSLKIKFSDGKINTIDMSSILNGELYEPLRNEKIFRQVKIDPEVKTLVWPNGADFDPATLYDWDNIVNELRDRSITWEKNG